MDVARSSFGPGQQQVERVVGDPFEIAGTSREFPSAVYREALGYNELVIRYTHKGRTIKTVGKICRNGLF